MTTFGYGLASSADGRVYDWVFPLGTTYWDQMAAMIAYLGQKEGGLDKLKGKKIAFLYHDSAYGKEPIPVLDALGRQARLRGAEDSRHAARPDAGIAVAADPPGEARLRDRVDLRRDEHRRAQDGGQDRLSARQAARRLVGRLGGGRDSRRRRRPRATSARRSPRPAPNFPVMQDIKTKVYGAKQGQPRGSDAARQRDVHARRRLRHDRRRGAARRAGEVRQGQGDDARAAALGLRAPEPHRGAHQGARRRRASSRRSRRAAPTTKARAW